jgi:hypothetical protein
MAGNGRALAVSAAAFEDQDAARAAFLEVSEQADVLAPKFTRSPSPNEWEWLAVTPDDVPLAVSGRPYDREGTCRAAYRRFLASVGGEVLV